MINRRSALIAIGALGITFAAVAQGAKLGRTAKIGRLSPLSAETDAPGLDGFRKWLRDTGWVDGTDFVIEARYADGN